MSKSCVENSRIEVAGRLVLFQNVPSLRGIGAFAQGLVPRRVGVSRDLQ